MTTRTVTREYTCHAQLELFTVPYEELPEEWQQGIMEHDGLLCWNDGRLPGGWCADRCKGRGVCAWYGGTQHLKGGC